MKKYILSLLTLIMSVSNSDARISLLKYHRYQNDSKTSYSFKEGFDISTDLIRGYILGLYGTAQMQRFFGNINYDVRKSEMMVCSYKDVGNDDLSSLLISLYPSAGPDFNPSGTGSLEAMFNERKDLIRLVSDMLYFANFARNTFMKNPGDIEVRVDALKGLKYVIKTLQETDRIHPNYDKLNEVLLDLIKIGGNFPNLINKQVLMEEINLINKLKKEKEQIFKDYLGRPLAIAQKAMNVIKQSVYNQVLYKNEFFKEWKSLYTSNNAKIEKIIKTVIGAVMLERLSENFDKDNHPYTLGYTNDLICMYAWDVFDNNEIDVFARELAIRKKRLQKFFVVTPCDSTLTNELVKNYTPSIFPFGQGSLFNGRSEYVTPRGIVRIFADCAETALRSFCCSLFAKLDTNGDIVLDPNRIPEGALKEFFKNCDLQDLSLDGRTVTRNRWTRLISGPEAYEAGILFMPHKESNEYYELDASIGGFIWAFCWLMRGYPALIENQYNIPDVLTFEIPTNISEQDKRKIQAAKRIKRITKIIKEAGSVIEKQQVVKGLAKDLGQAVYIYNDLIGVRDDVELRAVKNNIATYTSGGGYGAKVDGIKIYNINNPEEYINLVTNHHAELTGSKVFTDNVVVSVKKIDDPSGFINTQNLNDNGGEYEQDEYPQLYNYKEMTTKENDQRKSIMFGPNMLNHRSFKDYIPGISRFMQTRPCYFDENTNKNNEVAIENYGLLMESRLENKTKDDFMYVIENLWKKGCPVSRIDNINILRNSLPAIMVIVNEDIKKKNSKKLLPIVNFMNLFNFENHKDVVESYIPVISLIYKKSKIDKKLNENMESLLKKLGITPDSIPSGKDLLTLAIEEQDLSMMKRLLAGEIDMNSEYKQAPSLFIKMLEQGYSDIVGLMVEGENIHKIDLARYIYINSRTYKLFDCLIYNCYSDDLINRIPMEMLFQIIEKGNYKALRDHLKDFDSYIFHRELLIDQFRWLLANTKDENDKENYKKMIESLEKVKFSKTRSEVAEEALERAKGDQRKIIEEWINSEPTIIPHYELEKESAIPLFKKENEEKIKNMIASEEISQTSLNNILIIAAQHCCTDIIDVLLDVAKDSISEESLFEACRIAVYEGYFSVLEILLRRTNVNINKPVEVKTSEYEKYENDDNIFSFDYNITDAPSLISYLFALQKLNTCIGERTNMVKMMLKYRELSSIDLVLDVSSRTHDYNVWNAAIYYCSDKDLTKILLLEGLRRLIADNDLNRLQTYLNLFEKLIYDNKKHLDSINRDKRNCKGKSYVKQTSKDDYAEMGRLVRGIAFDKTKDELKNEALLYLNDFGKDATSEDYNSKKQMIEKALGS